MSQDRSGRRKERGKEKAAVCGITLKMLRQLSRPPLPESPTRVPHMNTALLHSTAGRQSCSLFLLQDLRKTVWVGTGGSNASRPAAISKKPGRSCSSSFDIIKRLAKRNSHFPRAALILGPDQLRRQACYTAVPGLTLDRFEFSASLCYFLWSTADKK